MRWLTKTFPLLSRQCTRGMGCCRLLPQAHNTVSQSILATWWPQLSMRVVVAGNLPNLPPLRPATESWVVIFPACVALRLATYRFMCVGIYTRLADLGDGRGSRWAGACAQHLPWLLVAPACPVHRRAASNLPALLMQEILPSCSTAGALPVPDSTQAGTSPAGSPPPVPPPAAAGGGDSTQSGSSSTFPVGVVAGGVAAGVGEQCTQPGACQ